MPSVGLFHVTVNERYSGLWWKSGGEDLWIEYAPDPVDRDFIIPQVTFMAFLADAQRIRDWESDGQKPVVWRDEP